MRSTGSPSGIFESELSRGEQNLVAAQPTDSSRVRGNQEPIIFAVEDSDLRAVVKSKGVHRFVERPVADNGFRRDDNGALNRTRFMKCGRKTGTEHRGHHTPAD